MAAIELVPGVRGVTGALDGVEAIGERVAELAELAAESGTFGVGGVLVGHDGRVYAEAVNAVLRPGRPCDPTAHVERQLVDWYFLQRNPPPIGELTIATSLDPCAMCAGAMLQAGFRAAAIAADPLSGIHDEAGLARRLPPALWDQAEATLTLLPVSAATRARCEAAFAASLDRVRATVGAVTVAPGPLPPGLHRPGTTPLPALVRDGRCCLIDDHGRPLLVANSAAHLSPARSAVLELVRGHGWAGATLPPRRCAVVRQHPPASPALALMELGALGSFLELPREDNPYPLLSCLEGDGTALAALAQTLPPLYRDRIGVTAGLL
ncbi:nucleoside deaminase [Phaeospirillum tilakii]|uniref:Nucleoside deaminase n=1 Tax=Phaeospirillum tilakii TaxID=741673 RepID=A0ABW5CBF6_9PROT